MVTVFEPTGVNCINCPIFADTNVIVPTEGVEINGFNIPAVPVVNDPFIDENIRPTPLVEADDLINIEAPIPNIFTLDISLLFDIPPPNKVTLHQHKCNSYW